MQNRLLLVWNEETIWRLRFKRIEEKVIASGNIHDLECRKRREKFYRSLSDENREKVTAFVDVDEKKIKKEIITFEETKMKPNQK